MKSLILLFCVISCVTCISEGEADRYKKCLQDYAAKTEQLDAYCETKISQLKEGIDDSIKSILKRENMTECGWKLFKDYKVDEIALNAFIQQYSNSTIDKKSFEKEIKNTFEYLALGAKIYCFSLANAFKGQFSKRNSNASDGHSIACMIKYSIDINIIDPKLYNISEGIYANEDCEAEFELWRENFPSSSLSLFFNSYKKIFGLPSAKVLECEHQKAKEEKLNEQAVACIALVHLNISDAQFQEIRTNYVNLYKKFLENKFECLDKIF
ncbi:CLUMA_CG010289, isoform A [Clunio marinus]|uniref:CLUMA_CG010289, isoform A n=1 Tax=Clunio marinus TaxID=568069 RepID=A0A1J1ICK8_9DIPT|nr:CLUMA_CG010289, isoform A [Clunio marinus]